VWKGECAQYNIRDYTNYHSLYKMRQLAHDDRAQYDFLRNITCILCQDNLGDIMLNDNASVRQVNLYIQKYRKSCIERSVILQQVYDESRNNMHAIEPRWGDPDLDPDMYERNCMPLIHKNGLRACRLTL